MSKEKNSTKDPTPDAPEEALSSTVTETKIRPENKKRSIMRSFFSHIIFAAIAVAGVSAYYHWNEILTDVGGRVCAYEVLGRYGSNQPVVLGTPIEKTQAPAVQSKKSEQQISSKKPEVEKLPAAAAKTPVSVKVVDDQSMQAAWLEARRAYWAGEEGAENAYLALIDRFPDQADIRGELGNIYIKSGREQQAAAQFLSAGKSLIKSSQKEQVARIVDLLNDLDPAKAEELKKALAAAG